MCYMFLYKYGNLKYIPTKRRTIFELVRKFLFFIVNNFNPHQSTNLVNFP